MRTPSGGEVGREGPEVDGHGGLADVGDEEGLAGLERREEQAADEGDLEERAALGREVGFRRFVELRGEVREIEKAFQSTSGGNCSVRYLMNPGKATLVTDG